MAKTAAILRDAGGIADLVRDYDAPLRAFFRRRVDRRSECEDLTQEVFLRLVRRGSLDDVREIRSFIFQTAANVLTDHHRRRAARSEDRTDQYNEFSHAPEDFSPERVMQGRQDVARLFDVVHALPERARTAFVLFRFEGMRQAEIAKRMGISVSAVEKHIKLAMTRVIVACRDDA